jgi:nucleoside-diphosphate-sugar epimerase
LKILVTGANGFTGCHFIKAANEAGMDTVVLNTNLLDAPALIAEISKMSFDYVVHLGAISFVGHAQNNAFYNVNVLGTLNLLDALATLDQKPKSILLASSANIYGNTELSPITEIQPPNPVNHYAASKFSMELMARNYLSILPIFFVRPFNYTGVGQASNFVIPKIVSHFIKKAASIELGNMDVEREFNDVRFVCDAYLKLLYQAQLGEAYNICTGYPIALVNVIDTLTTLTGHSIQVNINPLFVRSNEIKQLYGSPLKLNSCVGSLRSYNLIETLEWMLLES